MLPDARLLTAASGEFDRSAKELDRAAEPGGRRDSDAFTALVVMVPTMSEYFGQWKESRFVAAQGFDSESFNVVSRLSDINDILAGLDVIYAGVEPRSRRSITRGPGKPIASSRISIFIYGLHRGSGPASPSPPSRPTSSAPRPRRRHGDRGPVSQAAAALGVEIAQ